MMWIARIIVCVDYCLNQDFQDLRIRTSMKSPFSRPPVFLFSRFLILSVAATLLISQAAAQVIQIPDTNLERAIREALNIPDNSPITQQEMLRLTELNAR